MTRKRRPVVYLTLGTVVADDDVLRPAIEGLARLDADVLVALGSACGKGVGAVPANVHLEPFVDQATVMGLVDLVVHHGGSGTILAALANAVPQVLMPKGADQWSYWPARSPRPSPDTSPKRAARQRVGTLRR
jgi:UDP:flavonoid glycosyltransferase YjiC (YdhE family)